MRHPKLQYYKSASGDWRWRLKAANGEIVASGEGYVTKAGVLRGIDAFHRCARTCRLEQVTQ